jgi:Peptidyl-prolyl cis-trans isomerase (rotamase) - cyclophilin family
MSAGFRQMMTNPANKPLVDSLNQLYMSGDMDAYKRRIYSLTDRIEKETGIKVTKFVAPEKIKAYTTVGGAPHLDDGYTVFGKVIKGLEIIDQIASVQRDGNDRPMEDVRITVTVEELSRKKISKLYDYEYPEIKK